MGGKKLGMTVQGMKTKLEQLERDRVEFGTACVKSTGKLAAARNRLANAERLYSQAQSDFRGCCEKIELLQWILGEEE